MGIMVYSLLWVMQDFVHQPYGLKINWNACKHQRAQAPPSGVRGAGTPTHQAPVHWHSLSSGGLSGSGFLSGGSSVEDVNQRFR